ncbi:MAG: oligosaccharide flippase family protein, partial [Flavobacteriales bacterium]|nr:oligosaccharide flippase family protein [Flavobacteriales bacterium]
MGIVQKQGISVAFVSFVGVVIGALNTLFVFPNVLGAERHGLVMLILAIATVIAQFAHLGIPNTIIRFFPYLKDHKKYIYRLALQIPLMSIALLVIGAFLFGDWFFQSYAQKNALFDQYQPFLLPLVASLVFFEVLLSISRSELKTVFPAVLREFVLRLMTLLLLGAYFMSWIDFDQFIYYWLAIYGLNVFLLGAYLLSSNYLKLEFGFPLLPENSLAKKMLHYGGITLLTSSAAILVNRIDVLMLGHYMKIENVAFYTVAFFMASLIEIPARSILQIVKPLLAKAWSDGDVNEIATLYRKTSINQMIIGLLLFIGIWMSIDDVLTFVPEKYQGIQMVFFYVGLAKLIDVSAGVNGTIIATSDKYRFDLYINLFLILVTVITNVIFIPKYGI